VPRTNPTNPNEGTLGTFAASRAFPKFVFHQMETLLINSHLTYPGWSEGKLNLTLMELAKTFFVERGHTVTETMVERGYKTDEEVSKHAAADLVILQTPVNWFGAPWIYKKYVDEVFNAGIATKVFLEGDGRTRLDLSRQHGTGDKMQGKKFMVSATWNARARPSIIRRGYSTVARGRRTYF
jgi:NADPH dehydrogenase (quinone)